jgi:predicted DCC family thiol-disulfide oxidoreductase YuxK
VADRLYDRVARIRRRLFRPPADACPVGDPARRERFLP